MRTKKTNLTQDNVEEIRQLREGFWQLAGAQEQLQRQFRTQLLLGVAQNSVALLTRGLLLYDRLALTCRLVPRCLGLVLSFGSLALRFSLLTAACHAVTAQAGRCAQEVSQLLARQLEPRLQREFQLLEAVVKSRRIIFSAHGFFTIDLQLFLAVGGAVASYILIITQLKE